jgi:L-ascorbate metabolism protein UlaG (beta-lactamase superfamily)
MSVKRVIEGVQVVPMGMANAFLIEGDDGLTLIDAGFPGKQTVVFGAIRGLGRSPDQLKHLIFTHGHPDHIGSAAAIVRGDVYMNLMGLGDPVGFESLQEGRASQRKLASLSFDAAGFGHGAPIARDASTLFRNQWGEKAAA